MKLTSDWAFKQKGSSDFGLITQRLSDGREYREGSVLTPKGIVNVTNQPIQDFPYLLRFDMVLNGYHYIKSYKVKKLYSKRGLVRLASNFVKEISKQ